MQLSSVRFGTAARLGVGTLALYGLTACQPQTGVTPNRDSTIVSTGNVALGDSARAAGDSARALRTDSARAMRPDSAAAMRTDTARADTTASARAMPSNMPGTGTALAKATPRMQSVLDVLQSLGGKPIETLTPAEARQQPTPTDAVKALLQKEGKPTTPPPGGTTADRTIPGPGGDLPVRVYTPEGGTGPFPVIVYFHGGGWVIASKEVYDAGARALSQLANAVVVSVDYRLAPEHKFPAAHDDALASYEWALRNASSINGDSARVALAGESAGGNLAVATAIGARSKGLRAPLHVLAVYPIANTDAMTPSKRENADAKPLNTPMIAWFGGHYTRTPADLEDPRINLVAAELKGLPPTTIITAEIDPLRSEGQQLADMLKGAGVDVASRNYTGVAHEFFGMNAVLDEAKDAQQFAADRLKASLKK